MEKKSDGVKDVFKWLEKECKAQKKRLDAIIKEKEKGTYYQLYTGAFELE